MHAPHEAGTVLHGMHAYKRDPLDLSSAISDRVRAVIPHQQHHQGSILKNRGYERQGSPMHGVDNTLPILPRHPICLLVSSAMECSQETVWGGTLSRVSGSLQDRPHACDK